MEQPLLQCLQQPLHWMIQRCSLARWYLQPAWQLCQHQQCLCQHRYLQVHRMALELLSQQQQCLCQHQYLQVRRMALELLCQHQQCLCQHQYLQVHRMALE
jgi:hypothetical protein